MGDLGSQSQMILRHSQKLNAKIKAKWFDVLCSGRCSFSETYLLQRCSIEEPIDTANG